MFAQCEEQRRLLEEATVKREHLERNSARLEKRCEALSASVDETRAALVEARRECSDAVESSFKSTNGAVEDQIGEIAKRPSRDEVERLVSTHGIARDGDFSKKLDALERRLGDASVSNAARVAQNIGKREEETKRAFKKALDAQRRWITETLSAAGRRKGARGRSRL